MEIPLKAKYRVAKTRGRFRGSHNDGTRRRLKAKLNEVAQRKLAPQTKRIMVVDERGKRHMIDAPEEDKH